MAIFLSVVPGVGRHQYLRSLELAYRMLTGAEKRFEFVPLGSSTQYRAFMRASLSFEAPTNS